MVNHLKVRKEKIFDKIVTSKDGRVFRVGFIVTEIDGKLCWRVISVSPIVSLQNRFPIPDSGFKKREIYCLESEISLSYVKDKGLRIKDSYLSPYFDNLKFFVSQMTRAPSSPQ